MGKKNHQREGGQRNDKWEENAHQPKQEEALPILRKKKKGIKGKGEKKRIFVSKVAPGGGIFTFE